MTITPLRHHQAPPTDTKEAPPRYHREKILSRRSCAWSFAGTCRIYPGISSSCSWQQCLGSLVGIIPQQQNFSMGSLAQISSGAIRCNFNTRFRTRFRRVPAQIPGEVPKGSGADTWWGSGRFRWRVRFQKVPVQRPCEVREGSGADTWWGSGVSGEVPEGSSADTLRGSGGWCRCFVKLQTVPTFFYGIST